MAENQSCDFLPSYQPVIDHQLEQLLPLIRCPVPPNVHFVAELCLRVFTSFITGFINRCIFVVLVSHLNYLLAHGMGFTAFSKTHDR